MNNGVIFYNINTKCLIRLCVAMYALRKHYQGHATLMYDGELPEFVREVARLQDIRTQLLPDELNKEDGNALVRKSMLWRYAPYDNNLFMDSDTLLNDNIDEIFPLIEKHGLIFTQFSDWETSGTKISKRIKSWEPAIGKQEMNKALAHGKAVNTGVFGFAKNKNGSVDTFLKEWEILSRLGWRKKCTKRIVDEIACQVLLHKYPHHMVDDRWNSSVRFASHGTPKIFHYHGSKHVGEWEICLNWKMMYVEMRASLPDYLLKDFQTPRGDKRFGRWLEESDNLIDTTEKEPREPTEDDITIVTAVNPKYDAKLQRNLPLWLKQDFFKNKKIIVFVNGYKSAKERKWLDQYPNVKVIRHDHKPAGDNVRHRMLSAFVFGVAKHVDTTYWLKLDADCTPKDKEFELPENWNEYSVISHRWGYTKMKGDPNHERHWLNRLDDWYVGEGEESRLFPDNITTRTYRHKRFASFCHLEETQMTRNMADDCGSDLVIPSQDTLSWYYATQEELPILYTNMKKFFSP